MLARRVQHVERPGDARSPVLVRHAILRREGAGMIQRATSVLGVLLLAGCGSSPQPVKCDPPPGTSGSLTAAYLGQTYALSCFSATL